MVKKFSYHFLDEYIVFSESRISFSLVFSMVRRKYELHQFLNCDFELACPFQSPPSSNCSSSSCYISPDEKKRLEKQTTGHRIHGLGHAFRNSWRRSDHKTTKKSNSMVIVLAIKRELKRNLKTWKEAPL